jgi:predicted ATPase
LDGGTDQHEEVASAEAVRKQLTRILRSPTFTRAPSLSRFLTYLVEQRLAGNAVSISEYSLGLDVFDRGESFDPTTDTIVRAQARRLRSKLEEYYTSEGGSDPVVLEVPKGQYTVLVRAAGFANNASASDSLIEDLQRLRVGLTPPLPLPTACTSFVGREGELAEVKQLLRSEHVRLVTLTGAGGSGKTRLALQTATALSADFPAGVYMASLASVVDPDTVTSRIAQTVGLRHTGGRPLNEALPLYVGLVVQAPMLLFLDNFEQVIEAAPLLAALLGGCPQLKILVTSRALLELSGEHEYPVAPLPKPDLKRRLPLDELAQSAAVSLFVQRAKAVNTMFSLTEENAQAVAEICARLDGLPLAIELAAVRVKILPPAAILGRLYNSLDLLTTGYRDLPARHQTLRSTIDWSHGLLSTAEQLLFRRLSVFAGGCTLESAEAVCDAGRDLGISVLDGVSSLVSQNLLQRGEQQREDARFTMMQTIREYAVEKLAAAGEVGFTRRAHAAYCLVLAEEGAAQTSEEDRASWLAVWDSEHDNLRDALDWLIQTDSGAWALRLANALFPFWQRREHFAEGRERLEAVLRLRTAASLTPERARAAWYASILANNQGDYTRSLRLLRESVRMHMALHDQKAVAVQLGYIGHELHMTGNIGEARSYFEQSVEACRALGDRAAIAGAVNNLAEFLTSQGEYAPARQLFEEALGIFRELGNENSVGWSLNHLGDIAFYEKDFAEARRLYNEACDVFRRAGDRWGIARSFTDLGRLASEQYDQEAALCFFEQAFEAFLELGHTRGVARVLEGLACVAVRAREFERALTLAAAAEGLRQRVGAPKRPAEQAGLLRILEPAWQDRGEAVANALWAEGLRMPLEAAIRYVPGWTPSLHQKLPRS